MVEIVAPGAAFERRRTRALTDARLDNDRELRRLKAARARNSIVANAYDDMVSDPFAGGHTARRNGLGVNAPDANFATLEDLPYARERARKLALVNPLYVSARNTLVDFVVGQRGFVPSAQVDHERLGITESQAREWQDAVDRAVRAHMHRADVTGETKTFGGFTRLLYREMLDGGDVFVAYPLRAWEDGVRAPRMALIPAERVDTPPGMHSDPDVNGGVRTNRWGQAVGWHVYKQHPGSQYRTDHEFEFWQARRAIGSGPNRYLRTNMMQVFRRERVGQARGIPRFASCLDEFDRITEYSDVVMEAADSFARLALFIHSQADPEDVEDSLTDEARRNFYATEYSDRPDINVLNKQDDIRAVGPTQPSQYYDQFMERGLRNICAVAKIPYSIAFADARGANYSTMLREFRAFQEVIRVEQEEIQPALQVYRSQLILELWLDGQILPDAEWADPRRDLEGYTAAVWTTPTLGRVDPTKEIPAEIAAIDAGILSPQDAILAAGLDPEEVLKRRVEWKKREEELDLAGAAPMAAAPGEEDEEPDPEDDDENVEPDENEDADDEESEDVQAPEEEAATP